MTAQGEETDSPRARRIVIGGLLAAVAMAGLDASIVSTALPTIATDLNGLGSLSWVITSFMLAQSASLLIYGKISDMYGRRKLFLAAVVIFVIGSLLCGIVHSMLQLIAMRALQGVGAAGIATLANASLADLVGPRERGRYLGLFTGTFALCSVAGPLVGGALTSLFGWRSVFLVNLPLGLAVLALLAWTLPASAGRTAQRVDFSGALLIIVCTLSGLLAISHGELGCHGPPWQALAGISFVSLLALVVHERRVSDPMLDIRLFEDPVFATCTLTNVLVMFPYFGDCIYLPLYLQIVHGLSPAKAGLMIVPQLAGMFGGSMIGGRLVSHYGRYKPLMVVGIAMLGLSMAAVGAIILLSAPLALLALAFAALGFGSGLANPNVITALQNAVDATRIGAATAFAGFTTAVAASAGMSASGAMLDQQKRAYITAHASADAAPRLIRAGVGDAATLSPADRAVVAAAYSHGIGTLFLIGCLIVASAACASFLIPNRKLRSRSATTPANRT